MALIHYQHNYCSEENVLITEVLHKYGIKRCYYAHLHGVSIRGALNGERAGITYKLVSADGIGFDPIKVN